MARQAKWKWIGFIGVLLGGLGALGSVFIRRRKARQKIF